MKGNVTEKSDYMTTCIVSSIEVHYNWLPHLQTDQMVGSIR